MIVFNKKAISPVVATALLLVVAVVAVVGFQGWYQSFSTNLFVDVEQDSGSLENSAIEKIIGDTLYLKAGNNLTVDSVRIDGNDCNINGTYNGTVGVDVSGCLENLSTETPEIVMVTPDRVLSKRVYLDNIGSSNVNVPTSLVVGSECRFKDNKTGCESYYLEDFLDGINVIHDTILGLYWQQSPHTTTMGWTDAQNNCSGIGYGWRLPTLVELETSLIDTGRASDPYVVGGSGAGNLFNNIVNIYYWTNTKYSSNDAYGVTFENANSLQGSIGNSRQVLCVKEDDNYQNIWEGIQKFEFQSGTGQERLSTNFTINASSCGGLGTIHDTITDLCWEQSPSTEFFTWPESITHCDSLSTAGGDWRTPEKAELMTLLFHNGTGTTSTKLNNEGFSNIQNGGYWSNTRYAPFPGGNMYNVDFFGGRSGYITESSSSYTLCTKSAS